MNTRKLSLACALITGLLPMVGCASHGAGRAETRQTGGKTSLYLDVHDLGPGNVTAEAVAQAHEKDLAVQGKHGVRFEKYWVDEQQGKVFCLAHAPSPEALVETHREAHGLLPDHVYAVTDGLAAAAVGGRKLFLDIHRLGPGAVTAEAVAEAHEKDLAIQGEHGVLFLQYWVDEADGTVMCLSEADNAAAVNATHAAAHGLLADEILEVTQGE